MHLTQFQLYLLTKYSDELASTEINSVTIIKKPAENNDYMHPCEQTLTLTIHNKQQSLNKWKNSEYN